MEQNSLLGARILGCLLVLSILLSATSCAQRPNIHTFHIVRTGQAVEQAKRSAIEAEILARGASELRVELSGIIVSIEDSGTLAGKHIEEAEEKLDNLGLILPSRFRIGD